MKYLEDSTMNQEHEIKPVDVATVGVPCFPTEAMVLTDLGHRPIEEICVHNVVLTNKNRQRKVMSVESRKYETCDLKGKDALRTTENHLIYRLGTKRRSSPSTQCKSACFGENTLITCENGLKEIQDVHIGDKVKTLSGKYLPVVKCHKTKYQKVMRLKVSGSESIIVTNNHPFYSIVKHHRTDGSRYFSSPEWVAVRDLSKNHMIGYRLDIPTLPESFITDAEAWSLGRWLADGSVDIKRSTPRIFISVGESKINAAREKLNELPYNIYENRPHKTAMNFTFTSNEFYNLIVDAGRGAANKCVPAFVFQLPYRLQKLVLDGYLSGDGHIRSEGNNTSLSATTVSRRLAYGIARLVRNCYHSSTGIGVSPAKNGMIDGRVIKANYDTYHISSSITTSATLSYFDGQILWQPVKSVEMIGESATVYNLSVLEDNTYEANTIICHDSSYTIQTEISKPKSIKLF